MAVNPTSILAGLSAAQMGVQMGQKYLPGIRKGIHSLFGSRGRQTAKNRLRSLATVKGVTQAVKQGTKLVKSGKVLKKATQIAGDVGALTSAVEGATGSNRYTQAIKTATDAGLSSVKHHHDALNQFVNDAEHHLSRREVGTT